MVQWMRAVDTALRVTTHRFRYTINQAGATDITVPIPNVIMPTINYVVQGTHAKVVSGGIVHVVCAQDDPSDRTTTTFRVQFSAPVAVGNIFEFTLEERELADDISGPA